MNINYISAQHPYILKLNNNNNNDNNNNKENNENNENKENKKNNENNENKKKELIEKLLKKIKTRKLWLDNNKNNLYYIEPRYTEVIRPERGYNLVYPVLYGNIKNTYPMMIKEGFNNIKLLKSENYMIYMIIIILIILMIIIKM